MYRLLAIAALAVAFFSIDFSAAQAQDMGMNNGYQFGYGFGQGIRQGRHYGINNGLFFGPRYGYGSAVRFHDRIEQPPYFALYPPVYYSDQIIRRPMGVSPFAAPPGVMPVEMMAQPTAETIINPYYGVKTEEETEPTPENTDT